jgi:hypothetical protein
MFEELKPLASPKFIIKAWQIALASTAPRGNKLGREFDGQRVPVEFLAFFAQVWLCQLFFRYFGGVNFQGWGSTAPKLDLEYGKCMGNVWEKVESREENPLHSHAYISIHINTYQYIAIHIHIHTYTHTYICSTYVHSDYTLDVSVAILSYMCWSGLYTLDVLRSDRSIRSSHMCTSVQCTCINTKSVKENGEMLLSMDLAFIYIYIYTCIYVVEKTKFSKSK